MNKKNISKIMKTISVSLLIFWLLLAPLVWLLRDGLGPDAVDSAGLIAFTKAFMTFYWGPILILLLILNLIIKKIK